MKDMYFRKFMKFPFLLAGIVLLAACSGMLDMNPDDSVTRKQMFNENKDPYAIKSGLYNTLQGLVDQRFVLGELRGDLVEPARGAKGNVDILEFMDHYITPDNKYLDWSGFYNMINQCNDALVTLPKTLINHPLVTPDDSFRYDHIISEVLWLRAWSYFTLVENWGDVPFFTTPVYNIDSVKALPPTNENIILDQIEKDLEWVLTTGNPVRIGYNWAWNRVNKMWNHETVNICAVVGLLGDILLYRDKFSDAWTQSCYLKILLDQPTFPASVNIRMVENPHSSFNINGSCINGGRDWFNVEFRYANENYNSSWFEQGLVLAFDSENTYGGGGIFKERHSLGYFTNNRPEEGGLYYVKPSKSIIEMFRKNLDRYRGEGYSYFIDDNFTYQTKDTLIWKYIGIDPLGTRREPFVTYGNIHILRTSDLYLKAAEAANRLGFATTARDILNQNRGRVSVIPANLQADATVEEIEDAILEERGLELAFEGERWYDLVRIAKRRNDPNFLINKILVNVPESKVAQVRARLELQAKTGWKLPYSSKAIALNKYLSNNNR